MNQAEKEFDIERMKIYMAQPTEVKLRCLDKRMLFLIAKWIRRQRK